MNEWKVCNMLSLSLHVFDKEGGARIIPDVSMNENRRRICFRSYCKYDLTEYYAEQRRFDRPNLSQSVVTADHRRNHLGEMLELLLAFPSKWAEMCTFITGGYEHASFIYEHMIQFLISPPSFVVSH